MPGYGQATKNIGRKWKLSNSYNPYINICHLMY
jgi:hypothetical protein